LLLKKHFILINKMIKPVLFTCVFILFFAIYYCSIEEYRRGDSLPAIVDPNTPAPIVFSPCGGVFNWTTTDSQGFVYSVPESETVCTEAKCGQTFTGKFQNKETNPNLICSIPANKTVVCKKCKTFAISTCQFIPNNTPNAQIVTDDTRARSIIALTDPLYAVDKGTRAEYLESYDRYMNMVKMCNSPPPYDAVNEYFICPSSSPVATVNSVRMVVCNS
jgi:hypothetical protein